MTATTAPSFNDAMAAWSAASAAVKAAPEGLPEAKFDRLDDLALDAAVAVCRTRAVSGTQLQQKFAAFRALFTEGGELEDWRGLGVGALAAIEADALRIIESFTREAVR